MTTREQAFMRELKALLDKYDVSFRRDAVYYDGEDPNLRFEFPREPGATMITVDDMADLRGGWRQI